jgi:hypothetical protein
MVRGRLRPGMTRAAHGNAWHQNVARDLRMLRIVAGLTARQRRVVPGMIESGVRHPHGRQPDRRNLPSESTAGVHHAFDRMTGGARSSLEEIASDGQRFLMGPAQRRFTLLLCKSRTRPAQLCSGDRYRERIGIAPEVLGAVVLDEHRERRLRVAVRNLALGIRRIEVEPMTLDAMALHANRLHPRPTRFR